tara:strand:- start:1072 stop:1401 length:330 start_codon:yes stop_codon:yes gene_type:complete
MAFTLNNADGGMISFQNGYGNESEWVGTIFEGQEVASITRAPEQVVDQSWERRKDREQEFAITINILNPIWYNSLSDDQKTSIGNWRQAWLDYPNDENATEPERPVGIF